MASETYEYPVEGPWGAILRANDRIVYFPRDSRATTRTEWLLPSGAVLVDDFREGSICRREYYSDANIAELKPKGRPLKDRGILKRQEDGSTWFVFSYFDRYDARDNLVSSKLRLIEHHRGKQLLRQFEFDEDGSLVARGV